MIVLDTNLIAELMRPLPEPAVLAWADGLDPAGVGITAMNEAEILHGLTLLPEGRRKQALLDSWQTLVMDLLGDRVLAFHREAAHWYGELLVRREQLGRPIATADAVREAGHLQGMADGVSVRFGYAATAKPTWPSPAPRLRTRLLGKIGEQRQQLAVKGQQPAVQLLGQNHKLGVVTGAARANGQAENLMPVHGMFAQLQSLHGLMPERQGLVWLHKTRAHVLQQDMAKLGPPKRRHAPIGIAAQLLRHFKAEVVWFFWTGSIVNL